VRIGILGIQGDFDLHRKKLEEAGVEYRIVKKAEELEGIDGIIFPGGESTTITKILKRYELDKTLREKISGGFPVFATCAGIIMLASKFEGREEEVNSLGVLDVKIHRNAYGRQRESFEVPLKVTLGSDEVEITGVFIRAPKIVEVGKDVEVLGTFEGSPVLIRQGRILAMTFHPELSEGIEIYKFFENLVKERVSNV
jgi:5'-phosphate synthase pdxT subunit